MADRGQHPLDLVLAALVDRELDLARGEAFGAGRRSQSVVELDFRSEAEYAIARPCVLKDGELYRMWYPYRGEAYRIGYAESRDGLSWTRLDQQSGIEPSAEGWDSEMIEYPVVFDMDGERHMLFNGNAYGKTGVGWAILQQSV